MSLNERLAELCGFERNGKYWGKGTTVHYLQEDDEYASISGLDHWNPITDLNQLRMCYESLSGNEMLRLALSLDAGNPLIVFDSPDLVAQAILKAKGVS